MASVGLEMHDVEHLGQYCISSGARWAPNVYKRSFRATMRSWSLYRNTTYNHLKDIYTHIYCMHTHMLIATLFAVVIALCHNRSGLPPSRGTCPASPGTSSAPWLARTRRSQSIVSWKDVWPGSPDPSSLYLKLWPPTVSNHDSNHIQPWLKINILNHDWKEI